MKSKVSTILFIMAGICMLGGCGASDTKEPTQQTSNSQITTQSETSTTEVNTETVAVNTEATEVITEAVEYPSEEHNSEVWDSKLGYTMTYNPSVFTADNADNTDTFDYNTSEKLAAPVYVAIQSYPDMSPETVADGLVIQSGQDGVNVIDTNFGADSLNSKLVYVEIEVDAIKQVQVFHVIPMGEGSLLIEAGSYVGVPGHVDALFEEMFASFKLKIE